jgi:hypothetical protein
MHSDEHRYCAIESFIAGSYSAAMGVFSDLLAGSH